MLYDLREIENNSLIEGDICIVGAGAAGISMALDFMSTKYKVILLEGGGLEYETELQNLYRGKVTGAKYYPLHGTHLHYLGGTTNHWGGHCAPLDEIDFEKRDWVENSGWPISEKDLRPFYKETSEILDLGSEDFSLGYWLNKEEKKKKLEINNHSLIEKIWQYSAPTRFNSKYKSVLEESKNIHLYLYANVTNILGNESISEVDELEVTNSSGKKQKVRAKYFILACGGIQNARLLLASNSQSKVGLGNQYDVVGRYFMEHIHIRSTEFWMNNSSSMDLYLLDWGNDKASAQFTLTPEKQKIEKVLHGAFRLEPLLKNRVEKNQLEMYSNDDPQKNGYGLSFTEKVVRKYKKFQERDLIDNKMALGSQVIMEQAPNRNARVYLDKEKDSLGVHRANLNWEITEFEKESIRTLYFVASKEMGISDLARVKLDKGLLQGNDDLWKKNTFPGLHHMGTTRMSNNPKKGVVDSDCKVHSISNLFVAGSSCFATSGCANPTYSLIALSLRLSDHLKKRLKDV